ncbi:trigger factor [Arcanobacterium bovis]|uniref:trigger factor n=1 Tax=Arcanobacterium bovis TaxID=2529275 RepID=UPI001F501F1A|nr:trigger factor [Arcanobacterium bovis]
MSGEISVKNSVEYLSETRVQLDVAVSAEEFKPAYEKAAKSLAKQVNIPGFRPGKAPRRVLEANIGKGYIIEQAINDNLDSYYQQAVVEADVRPMSRPEVSINEVPEMSGNGDNTELKFIVEVDVRPEISLPNPADITIEVPSTEVSDDDVATALVDLQERFATLTDVNRKAKKGDYVNIDLVAKIGDEEVDDVAGVSYRIGDGNMLEGQDKALTGAKAGDVVEFTAKLAGGDHEGEEANVTVTVHSVKESVLPEADDEFAQLASEFDTIDELKADLRENAAKSKADAQLMGAEQKLIAELEKLADFPLPQSVIEEEVANHLQNEGKDANDEHGKEIRAEIEKQLKLQLLLDEYAEGFGVDVAQDELLNFLLQQAQMYGMDPNQFIQAAAQANQLNAFAGELARNKAIIAAMRLAKVVDDKGNAVDVVAVLGEAPENEKLPEFNKKATRKVTKKADEKKASKKADKVEEAELTADEAAEEGEAPAKSALKADWIAYRVSTGELSEAEAKKLTKDELINFGA